MARGDVKWFASFALKAKQGVGFSLNGSDTLKMGIVTSSNVPTVDESDPRWGAGGSTDFSTNQVATATAYTGPITLASVTYTRSAGVDTLDFADILVAQDAAGFTNGAYGIIYDDTVSGKYAIGFIDLGGPVSLQSGPLVVTWNASGVLQETAT